MPSKNPRFYLVHIVECCGRSLDDSGGIVAPDIIANIVRTDMPQLQAPVKRVLGETEA